MRRIKVLVPLAQEKNEIHFEGLRKIFHHTVLLQGKSSSHPLNDKWLTSNMRNFLFFPIYVLIRIMIKDAL